MRKFNLFGFVALMLATIPLEAQTVTFAKGIDFPKYKTYKWVTISRTEELDELTAGQLMGTIEVELEKKGLTRAKTDDADLLIAYQIASGKGKALKNLGSGASYGSTGANAGTTAAVTTIHSGELALDMYDGILKQLVWRGIIGNAIDANAKPDKKQKHMTHAVEKLLKQYPPENK